jgi:hypothetical protein
MAGLFAIAAGEGVDALLCAVASTMSDFVADDALNLRTFDSFGGLLLAVLLNVTKLAAIGTLGDAAIEWHAGTLLETIHVLLWRGRPTLGEESTLWLGTPAKSQLELLVDLTSRADESEYIRDIFFLFGRLTIDLLRVKEVQHTLAMKYMFMPSDRNPASMSWSSMGSPLPSACFMNTALQ